MRVGRGPGRVERIVASVVVLGALLFLVTAASGARRGSSEGEVHPLGFRVLGDVAVGVLGAIALLALVVWVDVLLSAARRHRRAGSAMVLLRRAPSSWWERLLRSLVALVVLVALGLVLSRGLDPLDEDPSQAQDAGWPPSPPGSRSATAEARLDWPVVVGIVLTTVGAVVVVTLVARRRRRAASAALAAWREPTDDRDASAVLAAVETTGLDELRSEPDPRRAVIRAYRAMGTALASWGLPRRPSETPFEFLERALVVLGASAGAARRLTVLFERAKFSNHPITGAAKTEAIDAVGRLRLEDDR